MWHQKIDQHITPTEDGSGRLIVLQIQNTKGTVLLANTYMPTAGTHTDIKYEDVADEGHELMQKYHTENYLLWVGDMNANPNNDKKSYSYAWSMEKSATSFQMYLPV